MFDPPAEHGLLRSTWHLFGAKTLGPDKLKRFQRYRVDGHTLYTGRGTDCRAIFRLPTVNLQVASVPDCESHRGQWGRILDGLGYPVQVVIYARLLRTLEVIADIREHGSEPARRLAEWLEAKLKASALIDRRRYLVIEAPDPTTLDERAEELVTTFRQQALTLERIETERELRQVVNSAWTPFAYPDRLGPSMVMLDTLGRDLVADGVYVRAYDVGKLPASLTTDWWQPFTDGDLPVDVSLNIEPGSVGAANFKLDRRWDNLATSAPTPKRVVAMQQVEDLRMAFERREVLPYTASITMAVRGRTRDEMERRARRLEQRAKDHGMTLRRMDWEQLDALLAIGPVRPLLLPKRGQDLETGTLARTTPLSSAVLQLPDGVPWGEAGNAPLLFTTFTDLNKNPHCCFYGTTGAGKGFGVRLWLSREHFQNDRRLFVFDGDEQQEYAGRFCRYLSGLTIQVRTLEDLDDFEDRVGRDARVVVFDLSQCPDRLYGQAFKRCKQLVQSYVLRFPGPAYFVVDEAANVLAGEDAALAIGDAAARFRHFGCGVVTITQRPTDFFDSATGRIQGNAGSWWCGQQNPKELLEVATALRLSPEEHRLVGKAGTGQGLLVTTGRRVWVDLFEKASPDEYAMAHTDPRGGKTVRRMRARKQVPTFTTNGQVLDVADLAAD